MDWDTAWLWLDRTSILLAIVLAVPILWTWWQIVFGEGRRRRLWLHQIARQPGQRPGALVIDLLPGKDIQACVRAHLAADETLAQLPPERIQRVQRADPLTPAGSADFAQDLRRAARALQDAGVDVIHCFFAGPGVAALITGAELANGARVLLYQYEQGRYLAYGPMEPLRPML